MSQAARSTAPPPAKLGASPPARRRRGRARRCARRRRRSAGTARAQPAGRAGDHHHPLPAHAHGRVAMRPVPATRRAPQLEDLGRGELAAHSRTPPSAAGCPAPAGSAGSRPAPARTASGPSASAAAVRPQQPGGSTRQRLPSARRSRDRELAVAGHVEDAGRVESMPCSMAPTTSWSQMKTKGLSEPRMAIRRGFSNSAGDLVVHRLAEDGADAQHHLLQAAAAAAR
jgi:hypothetical protein